MNRLLERLVTSSSEAENSSSPHTAKIALRKTLLTSSIQTRERVGEESQSQRQRGPRSRGSFANRVRLHRLKRSNAKG